MCVGVLVWLGWSGIHVAGCASACNTDTTPTQPHQNSNTHRTKNNTTNMVIQQDSCKLLMMDILITCWAHKKWNKIASDIELVFYSSTITMMHGPINVRLTCIKCLARWVVQIFAKFLLKGGVRITNISNAILRYIFRTSYQYARLESSNDTCIQVELPKQALFKIFRAHL